MVSRGNIGKSSTGHGDNIRGNCTGSGGGGIGTARWRRRWHLRCSGTGEVLMMMVLLLLLQLCTVTMGNGETTTQSQLQQQQQQQEPPFETLPPPPPPSTAPNKGSKKLPLNMYPDQHGYAVPSRVVWAAASGSADLTCNVTSPLLGDSPRLVLWYKLGIHKPIYSYDMRHGPATHWKSMELLGSRATFHARGARLRVEHVREADQGDYWCRVDFRTNPTLVFSTRLSVIVPPESLRIFSTNGEEARGRIGPLLEGTSLPLHCQVNGGAPTPTVTWWEGEVPLDMLQEESEVEGQALNTLYLPNLSRRDLHRTLTCRASNNNLTKPLTNSVVLDMNFVPLWTRILEERSPLSAGRPYDMECEAVGGRPSPRISWHLENDLLTSHTDQLREGGNVTVSELRWTPSVRDEGKVLTCKAHSPLLHAPPLSDSWTLEVYYVPVTRLRPGRSLNLSNIEEGDDVYFECSIKANPWVYKISWLHEKRELIHNVSGGVIISNQSLVLQRVTRWASGSYQCVAANTEGDGHSNPILLNVKYAPVCRGGQVEYHGAAKYEKVEIPCQLDAHPLPSAFTWTFNNSGESVDIPQSHIKVFGAGSTVSYTPNTELDYGTLLCWGTNSVGTQRWPCVFHVFPAGRPDPVHNCSVYNLSESVVNVRCVAGFDGGLTQTFVMELYHPLTNALLANVTSKVPLFTVEGLEAGLVLMAVVYSSNEKGRGEMVSLRVYTIKDLAEKRTAAVKPPPTMEHSPPATPVPFTSIGAVVAGLGGGATIVGLIVGVLLKLRGRRGDGGGCGSASTTRGKDPGKEPAAVCDRGGGRGGGVSSSIGGGLVSEDGSSVAGDIIVPPPPPPTQQPSSTIQPHHHLLPHQNHHHLLHHHHHQSHVVSGRGPNKTTTTTSLSDLPTHLVDTSEERSSDLIHLAGVEGELWPPGGVNTISTAALVPAYATLPRTAHLHTTQSGGGGTNGDDGGGGLQYSELVVTGPANNTTTNTHRQRHHQHHDQTQSTPHTPPQQKPPMHTQPQRVSTPPILYPPQRQHHTHPHLQHIYPHPPPPYYTPSPQPTAGHFCSTLTQSQQQQRRDVWEAATSTLSRRHSLRRDPYVCRDVASTQRAQKESSV